MNLRGNSPEETITNYNEFKRGLKEQAKCKDFEITLDTIITVYTELLVSTRRAYFQLKQEGRTNELQRYATQGIGTKTTLGHLHRIRDEHRRKRDKTQIPDWFERARRINLGITQEGSPDDRS